MSLPSEFVRSSVSTDDVRVQRLDRLVVEGFLSYGPQGVDFDLGSLNVLVGPNGSGKTNLLEALRVLRSSARDFGSVMYAGGGVETYVWRGELASVGAGIRASMSLASQTYEHSVRFENRSGIVSIVEETIRPLGTSGLEPHLEILSRNEVDNVYLLQMGGKEVSDRRGPLKPNESGLEKGRDLTVFPYFTGIATFYESLRIYSDWTVGRNSPARKSVPAGTPSDILLEDASNLAFVLAELRSTRALSRVRDALRRLKENYSDFSIRPVGGQLQLFIEEDGIVGGINAMRLSDGTLRFLALAAILLHPKPPPLVVIDEPEIGMHPDLIEAIGEMIVEASQRCQLIIATHSPELLTALRPAIDRLYAFQAGPNGSEARGFSREELDSYLEDVPLGELWRQGDFGGNRF